MIAAKPDAEAAGSSPPAKGPYARAYPSYHGTVAEGVKTITWTGALPDDQYDEFVFQARLTDAVAPGGTVYFPVRQDCDGAVADWREIPAAGAVRPRPEIARPGRADRGAATAAPAAAPAASPATIKAGDLAITAP